MSHKDVVFTENKGKLEVIQPFTFLRGLDNAGEKMGQAKDEAGNVYDIYPSACNIPTCFCAAEARVPEKWIPTRSLTDEDRAEIGKQVQEGMTSGLVQAEGYRISWELQTNKFLD